MTPEEIIEAIFALEASERWRLFEYLIPDRFCIHCGETVLPCYCMRDE